MELLNAKVGLSRSSSAFPSISAMEILHSDRTLLAEKGTSFLFGKQPSQVEASSVELVAALGLYWRMAAKVIDLIR